MNAVKISQGMNNAAIDFMANLEHNKFCGSCFETVSKCSCTTPGATLTPRSAQTGLQACAMLKHASPSTISRDSDSESELDYNFSVSDYELDNADDFDFEDTMEVLTLKFKCLEEEYSCTDRASSPDPLPVTAHSSGDEAERGPEDFYLQLPPMQTPMKAIAAFVPDFARMPPPPPAPVPAPVVAPTPAPPAVQRIVYPDTDDFADMMRAAVLPQCTDIFERPLPKPVPITRRPPIATQTVQPTLTPKQASRKAAQARVREKRLAARRQRRALAKRVKVKTVPVNSIKPKTKMKHVLTMGMGNVRNDDPPLSPTHPLEDWMRPGGRNRSSYERKATDHKEKMEAAQAKLAALSRPLSIGDQIVANDLQFEITHEEFQIRYNMAKHSELVGMQEAHCAMAALEQEQAQLEKVAKKRQCEVKTANVTTHKRQRRPDGMCNSSGLRKPEWHASKWRDMATPDRKYFKRCRCSKYASPSCENVMCKGCCLASTLTFCRMHC